MTTVVLSADPGRHCGLCVAAVPRIGRVEIMYLGTLRESAESVFAELARAFQPTLVAIEMTDKVFTRARFGASMATGIAKASALGGKLFATATMLGIPAVEVSAPAWRRAIAGKANASDRAIKAALTLRCGGRLARCSAHARDALGAGIYGALLVQSSGSEKRSTDAAVTNSKSLAQACQAKTRGVIGPIAAERGVVRDEGGVPTRLFVGRVR